MFSCAMTHPVIMESYCTSPETEKKKSQREREREREREADSCAYLLRSIGICYGSKYSLVGICYLGEYLLR